MVISFHEYVSLQKVQTVTKCNPTYVYVKQTKTGEKVGK